MDKPLSRKQIELKRKGRMATANRWLGWVIFVAFALPRISNLLAEPLISDEWAANLNIFFWIAIFLHAFDGVYLYGLPEWKRRLRVVHMYLGFSVFLVILLNRTFVFVEGLNTFTENLMWLPVLAHVVLSARFLVQRWLKKDWDPKLEFYTGGNVVRNVGD